MNFNEIKKQVEAERASMWNITVEEQLFIEVLTFMRSCEQSAINFPNMNFNIDQTFTVESLRSTYIVLGTYNKGELSFQYSATGSVGIFEKIFDNATQHIGSIMDESKIIRNPNNADELYDEPDTKAWSDSIPVFGGRQCDLWDDDFTTEFDFWDDIPKHYLKTDNMKPVDGRSMLAGLDSTLSGVITYAGAVGVGAAMIDDISLEIIVDTALWKFYLRKGEHTVEGSLLRTVNRKFDEWDLKHAIKDKLKAL